MMNFTDRLEKRVQEAGNNICFGLDPIMGNHPSADGAGLEAALFFANILHSMQSHGSLPAFVKPNIAYWSSINYGLSGLTTIISLASSLGIMVILDGKRGDIGASSDAYYKEMVSYKADACTVSPYMGTDSVEPFLVNEEIGAFILCRTSNKGGADFQNLPVLISSDVKPSSTNWQCHPLYLQVADTIIHKWNKNSNAGMVVGATNLEELKSIATLCVNNEVPWLIPGVGKQGGSAKDVMQAIREAGLKRDIYIINSSSAIAYAGKGKPDYAANYAVYAVNALNQLIAEATV